jgi:hypothetical protein
MDSFGRFKASVSLLLVSDGHNMLMSLNPYGPHMWHPGHDRGKNQKHFDCFLLIR